MSPVARRVALAPVGEAAEDAVAEAALGVPALLEDATLVPGDEIATEPVRFLVTATEPMGPVQVDLDETVVDIDAAPLPSKKRVVDALLLVDASWTMGKSDVPGTRYAAGAHAARVFLRNAPGVIRHAALGVFNRDVAVLADAAEPRDVDPRVLGDAEPRGRTDLATAILQGILHVRRLYPPDHRHALLVATDGPTPGPELPKVVARAARLGVRIFVLDVGPEPSRILQKAAAVTRGAYHHAPEAPSFRFAAHALAEDVDAPLDWEEPPAPGRGEGDAGFEVVLRASAREPPNPLDRRPKNSSRSP